MAIFVSEESSVTRFYRVTELGWPSFLLNRTEKSYGLHVDYEQLVQLFGKIEQLNLPVASSSTVLILGTVEPLIINDFQLLPFGEQLRFACHFRSILRKWQANPEHTPDLAVKWLTG